jgi:hypothetical protein
MVTKAKTWICIAPRAYTPAAKAPSPALLPQAWKAHPVVPAIRKKKKRFTPNRLALGKREKVKTGSSPEERRFFRSLY